MAKEGGGGLGVNWEALLLVTQRGGLAGDSRLRLLIYAAAAGRLRQNKKESWRSQQPGFCSFKRCLLSRGFYSPLYAPSALDVFRREFSARVHFKRSTDSTAVHKVY